MDRTEEDIPKRHERPLKRQLNSHSHLLGAKVTVQMYPSPSLFGIVLSTILSVLAEKQKLKITINFQFLHCH